ncbi:MAG: hypothetical protein WBP81_34145 [Solirubrobacteraceae bacterium]
MIAPSLRRRSCRSRETARNRHHFGGGGDVKPGLAGITVGSSAQSEDDLAQRAVVHVDCPAPSDPQRVDLMRIALENRRVEQRGEQIVGGADRVDVAGEVKVQVLHRYDLGQPSTRRAAFDPEHGPQRRLAQAQDGRLSDRAEPLGQSNCRGGLALAGLGRRDPGHAHQFSRRCLSEAIDDRQ